MIFSSQNPQESIFSIRIQMFLDKILKISTFSIKMQILLDIKRHVFLLLLLV